MMRHAYAVIAYLIGLAGAGGFFAYVLGAGIGVWPRGEAVSISWSVTVNFGLLAFFAWQHSGMARAVYKNIILRVYPECIERSTYVGASGLALGALTLLWQPLPGEPIWHGPFGIVAISLAGTVGLGVCAAWFDHAAFFGLTSVAPGVGKLRIEGPYRFVRHPLMLGFLIAIWGVPVMPPELLMLNLGMTAYILIAIRWEERDLIRVFGAEYEEYRQKVPTLVPWWRA